MAKRICNTPTHTHTFSHTRATNQLRRCISLSNSDSFCFCSSFLSSGFFLSPSSCIYSARSLDKFNHPFHLSCTWIKLNRYKYYYVFRRLLSYKWCDFRSTEKMRGKSNDRLINLCMDKKRAPLAGYAMRAPHIHTHFASSLPPTFFHTWQFRFDYEL